MHRASILSIAIAIAVGAGCGRSAPAPAPPPPPPEATLLGGDLIDPGAGSGDVIVATVNGRPVWGSCVTGHVRARGVSVDQAVKDCVDLELLAAAAVARRLGDDAKTQGELRAALVDGFVGREFEDATRTAADLPAALVESNVAKNARELDRPELRSVVYARALWGEKEGPRLAPGTPEDTAAHALADELHAELAGRDDLFPADLFDAADRVKRGRFLKVQKSLYTTPRTGGGANEQFAAAIFAIPAIGQVSPPSRTPWGWDVILLVDVIPAETRTRDQLVADMFPGLRRGFFDQVWSAQLARQHQIEEYPDLLAEPGDEPEGSGAPP